MVSGKLWFFQQRAPLLLQISVVQRIKKVSKVPYHHITRSVGSDEINGALSKMDVILAEVCPIGHSTLRNSILSHSLIILFSQKKTIVLVDATVNMCSIADITLFDFLAFFLAVFDLLLFVVDEWIKPMMGNICRVKNIVFLLSHTCPTVKVGVSFLALFLCSI